MPAETTALLQPAVVLMLLTTAMWFWLYATRIPAIKRRKIKLDPSATKDEFNQKIPPKTRWKADNYNHLLEQPVLFYAVVFTLYILGESNSLNIGLAWGYVLLRIAHSLVQALWNKIILRFYIFACASFLLFALIARASMAVF